jgi:hypothetical protein
VDHFEHAVEVAEHVFVRKAQNVVPLRAERRRPSGVAGDFLIRRVRGAVDFDNAILRGASIASAWRDPPP